MENLKLKTPKRPQGKRLHIPPTPQLERLGYGTGVNVWKLNTATSPWAVKNVRRAMNEEMKNHYQNLIIEEAKVLSTLNHENIIGFRALFQADDGRQCLAMEAGRLSLGHLIETREEEGWGPFLPLDIIKVIHSVAKALKYLHEEMKLLHGDIKPYNIIVNGNFERIKLCDLGVSVRLDEHDQAENYVGTTVYNAPEVVEEVLVTSKSEIFSLGLVAWEMMSLEPPHCDPDEFDSSLDSGDSMERPENATYPGMRPVLPPGLGPEYEKVIDVFQRCTESDWKARPTAAEVVNLLQPLLK